MLKNTNTQIRQLSAVWKMLFLNLKNYDVDEVDEKPNTLIVVVIFADEIDEMHILQVQLVDDDDDNDEEIEHGAENNDEFDTIEVDDDDELLDVFARTVQIQVDVQQIETIDETDSQMRLVECDIHKIALELWLLVQLDHDVERTWYHFIVMQMRDDDDDDSIIEIDEIDEMLQVDQWTLVFDIEFQILANLREIDEVDEFFDVDEIDDEQVFEQYDEIDEIDEYVDECDEDDELDLYIVVIAHCLELDEKVELDIIDDNDELDEADWCDMSIIVVFQYNKLVLFDELDEKVERE